MKISTKLATMTVLGLSVGSAQALTIDSFNDGLLAFPGVFASGPAGTDSDTQGGSMLGGSRTIDLQMLAGTGTTAVTVIAPGVLDINNGVNERSEVTVSWAFSATDFTDGTTSTGLFMSLPSAIDNPMDVLFSLSDGGSTSTSTVTFPDGASGDDFFIPFAGFAGSADLTQLTSASVQISSSQNGLDTQIDFIETRPQPTGPVPEPSIALLTGFSLLGAGFIGKKKRK